MKWTKRNRRTVIVAACITVVFVLWLWGFTHQEPPAVKPDTSQEQPEPSNQEQEQPEPNSNGRYLPSSEEAGKEAEQTPEDSVPSPSEPEEVEPKEAEPAPEEPSKRDAPDDEDAPEWQSGWKEPEWPEWPEWTERNTTPRRTVTGIVGSVPRWDDR